MWIEGLPGVGKTFWILCIRNIMQNIHQRNSPDIATAPTGCTALQISGTTNYLVYRFPTAPKKVNKLPSNHALVTRTELRQRTLQREVSLLCSWMNTVWYPRNIKDGWSTVKGTSGGHRERFTMTTWTSYHSQINRSTRLSSSLCSVATK